MSYVRVSGKAQADGDGPERQRQSIARYAAAHGIDIIVEFSDLGVSGATELSERPGLASLLRTIAESRVRTVLVERADRLARDLMVQEVIVGQFVKIGATIRSADGVDLTSNDDPTRRLIRQVLGAVSQFEKDVIVLKLRAARDRKRLHGTRVEGARPYGHYPGELEAIERIRQLRRKRPKTPRLSGRAIAAVLNREGLCIRSGRPWSAQMVHHLLGTTGGRPRGDRR